MLFECCEKCIYKWHDTSWIKPGKGYAQCEKCHVIDSSVKESECVGYIAPEVIEADRKAKRKKERETKRLATIEYLRNNPHVDN